MAGRSNQDSKKSLLKAYFLLFFGGFLGLHHFYLHRSRQCFIYLITFGGYLGLGLIRDLWRLPEYVKDFNYDRDYAIQLKSKVRSRTSPASNFFREIIKISVGNMFGYFIILCIPQDMLKINEYRLNIIAMCLAPLGSAIGVHLAGNIGRHAGKLRHAIVGAYITCPLYYFFGIHQVFWSSLLAKYFFNRKLGWRVGPLRSNRAWYTRIFMITVSFAIFAAMVGSFVYFNCTYQDEYGNNIKCREAGLNFLNSPAVRDYQQAMRDLKNYIQAYGLKGIWNEIMEQFDFGGETSALSVLNLTESADEKEIRATYHKLSRKWHPDRYKDPKAQREAQDIYIQIQKAYETLSQTKIKRLKKNMRTDDGSGNSYDEL